MRILKTTVAGLLVILFGVFFVGCPKSTATAGTVLLDSKKHKSDQRYCSY